MSGNKAFKKSLLVLSTVIVLSIVVVAGHHRLRDRFMRSTTLGYWVVRALSKVHLYQEAVVPAPLRAEYVGALYQLMQDVHDVLEFCQIPYWIEAGTLLGAVRHQGLIPWDDDLDVQVREAYQQQVEEKAIPVFKALGYGVHSLPQAGGIKVHYTSKKFDLLPQETVPGCDIFYAREKKKGELSIWGCSKAFPLSDVYPLKMYAFGPVRVWGPAQYATYFERLYGKNWGVLGKRGNDHLTINGQQGSHNYFIIRDFSPALFSGQVHSHRSLIPSLVGPKNEPLPSIKKAEGEG
jgi:hypothetical protein